MIAKNISIITVVYNDLPGLKETKDSVQRQSFSNYEWIVCDGGSERDTLDYLLSLGDEVNWVSRQDKGIYDAMNTGVSMCNGDYVVFMNAGDVFYDNAVLGDVVSFLSKNGQGADLLFGGAMLEFQISGRSVYRPPRAVAKSIWHGLPANHQATFYRKKLLTVTPYDLKYKLCGDYYLVATLIKNGSNAVYLDKPLARFGVGGQSYVKRRLLFAEPYRIQRDVLGLPFYYRWASLLKRLVSTLGFILLAQSFTGRKKRS